jgi:8-oxo-dGTP diphosphatase
MLTQRPRCCVGRGAVVARIPPDALRHTVVIPAQAGIQRFLTLALKCGPDPDLAAMTRAGIGGDGQILTDTLRMTIEPDTRTQPQPLQVVAGLLRRADGRWLIARRPPGKADAGLWEFPGGKLEPGEDAASALTRELDEELGIRIGATSDFSTVHWRDGARALKLVGLKVEHWQGEPHAREHTQLAWVSAPELARYPMPAPDLPLRARIALPPRYLITPEPTGGQDAFLAELARAIAPPAIGLASIRARSLAPEAFRAHAIAALALIRRQRPELIALLHTDPTTARELGADGAHLSSAQLAKARRREGPGWLLASCHDETELRRAEALGVDAVVIGPVLPTASHPGAPTLGWEGYRRLAVATWLPGYALGGVGSAADVECVRAASGLGIAAISAFWPASQR